MQEILIILIYSYLLGSIPFGLILTKAFTGKDIRNTGSGNIGATNVFRSSGKVLAVVTLLLDTLKGYLAVAISINFFPEFTLLSSLIVFIGHIFPVWIKFKGGKGVATYLGILLALNYYFFFIFILSWSIIILIFKYASLASLTSALLIFLFNVYLNGISQSYSFLLFLLLIIYSHKDNIVRLKAGSEKKINL